MDEAKQSANVDWETIDIYLFSNGQQYAPPRKYHLRSEELSLWETTLTELARSQYGAMHSRLELYTINGTKVDNPMQLDNGATYVAVVPPDAFIEAGYEKYLIKASRSWEKRQKKLDGKESEDQALDHRIEANVVTSHLKPDDPTINKDNLDQINKNQVKTGSIRENSLPSTPKANRKPIFKRGITGSSTVNNTKKDSNQIVKNNPLTSMIPVRNNARTVPKKIFNPPNNSTNRPANSIDNKINVTNTSTNKNNTKVKETDEKLGVTVMTEFEDKEKVTSAINHDDNRTDITTIFKTQSKTKERISVPNIYLNTEEEINSLPNLDVIEPERDRVTIAEKYTTNVCSRMKTSDSNELIGITKGQLESVIDRIVHNVLAEKDKETMDAGIRVIDVQTDENTADAENNEKNSTVIKNGGIINLKLNIEIANVNCKHTVKEDRGSQVISDRAFDHVGDLSTKDSVIQNSNLSYTYEALAKPDFLGCDCDLSMFIFESINVQEVKDNTKYVLLVPVDNKNESDDVCQCTALGKEYLVIQNPEPTKSILSGVPIIAVRDDETVCECEDSVKNSWSLHTVNKPQDAATQTEWCNVLLEARLNKDGFYTFHFPPLFVLQNYK